MKPCPTCGHPVGDFCGIVLDHDAQMVRFRGASVRLTKTEIAYFLPLYERPARAVDKGAIYDSVYQLRPDCDQPGMKIVDVMICKLRRKLKHLGIEIETYWGMGYALKEPIIEIESARHPPTCGEAPTTVRPTPVVGALPLRDAAASGGV